MLTEWGRNHTMEKEKFIYTCTTRMCGYVFESNEKELKQCPDCGKMTVRKATSKEVEEYLKRPKYTGKW